MVETLCRSNQAIQFPIDQPRLALRAPPRDRPAEISPHRTVPARPEAMDKDGVGRSVLEPGKTYRITTIGHHGTRNTARVQTYGNVLEEYEFHPESKCADANGNPCTKQTVGLLQRRHIQIEQISTLAKNPMP